MTDKAHALKMFLRKMGTAERKYYIDKLGLEKVESIEAEIADFPLIDLFDLLLEGEIDMRVIAVSKAVERVLGLHEKHGRMYRSGWDDEDFLRFFLMNRYAYSFINFTLPNHIGIFHVLSRGEDAVRQLFECARERAKDAGSRQTKQMVRVLRAKCTEWFPGDVPSWKDLDIK